jgi:hypothetical protein
VRRGTVVARDGATGAERTLFRAEYGGVRAIAWSRDGSAIYGSVALELWRIPVDGSPASRVATIHDEANDEVDVLATSAAGLTLLAETVAATDARRYDNVRYFEVDPAAGRVTELSGRSYETLSGRLRRFTSREQEPLVSPSGRWALRVAPLGADVGASTEALEVAPVPSGNPVPVVTASKLPPDPSGAPYTNLFEDARWAPDRDTILFVAQTVCAETCVGPLFAVDPDGTNLRHLGASLRSVPDAWNGAQVAFEEYGTAGYEIVVADVATGERVDLGEGRSPVWKPESGRS